jgi:hypothetical protein
VTGEPITKKQIANMLTVCSHFDGRTLEPETFDAWHLLLGDLPYEDVEDAVRVHYRTSVKWIMPGHIVAHHEKLAAARKIEEARQNPPPCKAFGGRGCDVTYVLSDRPGSRYALPSGPHAAGCPGMQGIVIFDSVKATWTINPFLDPATFDEAALEAAEAARAADWAREAAAISYNSGFGGEIE